MRTSHADAIITGTPSAPPPRAAWEGRNIIMCDGRIVELVSDVDSVATSPGVAIATAVLLLATLAQLWTAYLVEPGIVPRTPPKPPCTREGNMRKTPPKNQYIVAAGKRTELRYCLVCELFTPPRSIHCSTCNSCIMRFDRNYSHFFRFLCLVSALNVLVLVMAAIHIIDVAGETTLGDALSSEIVMDLVVVYCVSSVWFTVGMVGYHTYLAWVNTTTFEQLGDRWVREANPYRTGLLACARLVWSGRPNTSAVKFVAVEDGSDSDEHGSDDDDGTDGDASEQGSDDDVHSESQDSAGSADPDRIALPGWTRAFPSR